MDIRTLEIPGPVVVIPKKIQDERGFLSETYVDEWFRANAAQVRFEQDNHTHSVHAGTIRGIHFQAPPHAQGKLVRVIRGAVWDVAVDLRRGSPTFGRHVGVELSAENWHQLWIPLGFGHAFCTLEPHSEVLYKVTARYHPSSDHGIRWNDPDLDIRWPLNSRTPVLSERDRSHGRLRDMPAYFRYDPAET
jgi:dTDP-4-dehydrorhamnose 3,5-epimerase